MIYNGNVVNKNPDTNDKRFKTVDFKIIKNGKIYYIFHKRTENIGGGQDYECAEIIHNLENSKGLPGNIGIFVVVLDGDYYTKEKRGYFSSLNSDAIIETIDGFIEILKKEDDNE